MHAQILASFPARTRSEGFMKRPHRSDGRHWESWSHQTDAQPHRAPTYPIANEDAKRHDLRNILGSFFAQRSRERQTQTYQGVGAFPNSTFTVCPPLKRTIFLSMATERTLPSTRVHSALTS